MTIYLSDIEAKVKAGQRLSFEDGVVLFQSDDIFLLGMLANIVRERLNGNNAYYTINLHINYTNICENRCDFCAFSKDKNEEGSFCLSVDDIMKKARSLYNPAVLEFHVVGGLNPKLNLDYYISLLASLKREFPHVLIQGFTVVEIEYIARCAGLSIKDTLERLKSAGLDAIPGGGAEIYSSDVRQKICPKKIPMDMYLDIMREAHNMGIYSNATMLFGHLESYRDRVEHLIKLRELQDETKGFLAFIPLPFHPKNSKLSHLRGPSAIDSLKTIAVSRLMLDNIPHIKSFWIMLGPKLSQISMSFGADDMDGTVYEERITHSAGATTPQCLKEEELLSLIKEAGRVPVRRDTLYNIQNA